jgi:molecular chaperone DnaJ
MKVGTVSPLTKATTTRIICPAQVCRHQRFGNDQYKRQQARGFGSSTPIGSRRYKIIESGLSNSRLPQRRVSLTTGKYKFACTD